MTALGFPLAAPAERGAAVGRRLERECPVVVVLALCAVLTAVVVPLLVTQDTWLALVDGRWIAQHGLPRTDALAVWTHGAHWTDQQWLAQLAMYSLEHVGGMTLLLDSAAAIAFGALFLAAAASRRAGASPRSVAIVLVYMFVGAPWLLTPRSQMFAVPLFVAVYALLAADARAPSRRVLYVLPLLVLWANLHGSAILAAGLVCLHALVQFALRRFATPLALLVCAPASLLVSPYGLDMAHYYSWMLVGSPVRSYVAEWAPTSFSLATASLFLTFFAVVAGLARRPRAVSTFERVALPLLVAAALLAMRNITWVLLAAIVSGPLLLDANWNPLPIPQAVRKRKRGIALGALALGGVATAAALARPASLESRWPVAGARRVAAAAGPHGLVLADDRNSDWLLWTEPQLEGRVAYDVRFELLGARRLEALHAFRVAGGPSSPLIRDYRVLLVPSRAAARRFGRVIYAAPGLVAVAR